MAGNLVLGIDLGTTACKALVVDAGGRVLGTGSAGYPTYAPRAEWAEQDADEVWQGLCAALQQALHAEGVDRQRVAALSLSSAMHGLLPLDTRGRPLTRCWIWADRRSQPQALRLRREQDAHALYLRTGCPVQPLFWPARLLWLREHWPDLTLRTRRYITVKDYVLQRLTGHYVMDVSNASATGLLDTRTLTWDEDLLTLLQVGAARLPELVLPEAVLGTLNRRWADAWGLPCGVQVVAGGTDGVLANLGAGAVAAGQVATSIGTSGAVRALSAQPLFDAQERTWCYVLSRGTWFVGGAISNGGIVYQWLRDQLCAAEVEQAWQAGRNFSQLFDAWADEVPPGAEGLLFLPFLLGERSPGWRANARGMLFGLSMHHTAKHVVRAAVEGVAFRLFSVLQVLEELLGSVREVRATGGMAYSDVWMRILADVYGKPISVPAVRESSALGAAFLALKALGHLYAWEDVRPLVAIERTQQPDLTNHELYLRLFDLFRGLYEDALPHCGQLEGLHS